jgi:UDP-apiose/xylose synthase
MNIAILGAGGFVGSHLVEHLLARGEHAVVGVDVADDKLAGIGGPAFTFRRADLRGAPELLDEVVRRADVVVDLIAYANPSLYVTAPLAVFELNFLTNLDVARLCMRHGRRLIQYSSAEVYGKSTAGGAYREDASDSVFGPVHKQRWIYATAKVLLERVLFAHGAAGDLDCTIVRPFNFLGSRIDYLVPAGATGGPRVFPHFMSALLTGGPIRLVGGGRVRRAFLHIDDANEAFQVLLDRHDAARQQIFNVGNPANDVAVRDFAALMCDVYAELTGRPAASAFEDIDGEAFYGEGYEDGDRLPPDVSKLRALGWAPRYGLRQTVRDAMEYYVPRQPGPPAAVAASRQPALR